MMTIRCRTRFSALLFCLPLVLGFATTAWAASDDDDEEWRDTKGPGGKKLTDDEDEDSDKSSAKKKASKSDEDSEDKAKKDSDEKASDEDKGDKSDESDEDGPKGKKKRKHAKHEAEASSSSSTASFALLGSYGFKDPLSAGLGLRGGALIHGVLPFYVGGIAEYFFGTISKSSSFSGVNKMTSELKLRFMYLGGEGGVEVEATPDIFVRPFIGLGIGVYTEKICPGSGPCQGGSEVHPVITPGIVGGYRISNFFVGPDIRYIIVPGAGTASGAAISLTAGLAL